MTHQTIRSCYLCDGLGCDECDHTGQRVCTLIEDPDGPILRVHGSAPLSPKTREALAELSRIVLASVDRVDRPSHRGQL